jgi:hypothetical protein
MQIIKINMSRFLITAIIALTLFTAQAQDISVYEGQTDIAHVEIRIPAFDTSVSISEKLITINS